MTDKEKVVKALECLKEGSYCECCDYKPYDDCIKRVATDALALLNEQEKEIENLKEIIKKADYTLEIAKDKINDLLKKTEGR